MKKDPGSDLPSISFCWPRAIAIWLVCMTKGTVCLWGAFVLAHSWFWWLTSLFCSCCSFHHFPLCQYGGFLDLMITNFLLVPYLCLLSISPLPSSLLLCHCLSTFCLLQHFIPVIHLNSPGGPACNYLSFYTAVARAAAGPCCLVSGSVDQWITLGGSQYISPQHHTSMDIMDAEICGSTVPIRWGALKR